MSRSVSSYKAAYWGWLANDAALYNISLNIINNPGYPSSVKFYFACHQFPAKRTNNSCFLFVLLKAYIAHVHKFAREQRVCDFT